MHNAAESGISVLDPPERLYMNNDNFEILGINQNQHTSDLTLFKTIMIWCNFITQRFHIKLKLFPDEIDAPLTTSNCVNPGFVGCVPLSEKAQNLSSLLLSIQF